MCSVHRKREFWTLTSTTAASSGPPSDLKGRGTNHTHYQVHSLQSSRTLAGHDSSLRDQQAAIFDFENWERLGWVEWSDPGKGESCPAPSPRYLSLVPIFSGDKSKMAAIERSLAACLQAGYNLALLHSARHRSLAIAPQESTKRGIRDWGRSLEWRR